MNCPLQSLEFTIEAVWDCISKEPKKWHPKSKEEFWNVLQEVFLKTA